MIRKPSEQQTGVQVFLRGQAWFSQLSVPLAKVVEETVQAQSRKAADPVYLEGDPATHWVGVMNGLLKMCSSSPSGKMTTIAIVSQNDWIGEASLITLRRRRFNLVAVRDSHVALVPRTTFATLYNESIPFNHFLFEQVTRRMGRMAKALSNDRLLSREGRVALCLGSLLRGESAVDAHRVALTQTEIGELTGFSRQHVAQALHHLESLNLIAVRRREISIIDPARLESFALNH